MSSVENFAEYNPALVPQEKNNSTHSETDQQVTIQEINAPKTLKQIANAHDIKSAHYADQNKPKGTEATIEVESLNLNITIDEGNNVHAFYGSTWVETQLIPFDGQNYLYEPASGFVYGNNGFNAFTHLEGFKYDSQTNVLTDSNGNTVEQTTPNDPYDDLGFAGPDHNALEVRAQMYRDLRVLSQSENKGVNINRQEFNELQQAGLIPQSYVFENLDQNSDGVINEYDIGEGDAFHDLRSFIRTGEMQNNELTESTVNVVPPSSQNNSSDGLGFAGPDHNALEVRAQMYRDLRVLSQSENKGVNINRQEFNELQQAGLIPQSYVFENLDQNSDGVINEYDIGEGDAFHDLRSFIRTGENQNQ